MVTYALEAAAVLSRDDGIEVEVVDLRTLVPLDIDTVVASVERTGRLVMAHEAWRFGGFGAEVASQVGERLFGRLDAPIQRVGARRSHIPFSPPLERAVVPQADEIIQAARAVVRYRAAS